MESPEVRYARSGDIDIAYLVAGDGPIDLVFVSGFVSHLDLMWEMPAMASRMRWLTQFVRVIAFDKRGTGLSDRTLGFGSAADRMDDIRAVMDAAGVERAAIMGVSEGGPLSILFAATYPERASKLVLVNTYPIGHMPGSDPAERAERARAMRRDWGTGRVMHEFRSDAPEEAIPFLARYERSACTPQMVEEIMLRNFEMDVMGVLPTLNVPALVIHTAGDPIVPVMAGRYLARHIPGAQYLEVEGDAHAAWEMSDATSPELRKFLVGDQRGPEPDLDRVLATVLFTDIVSSTEQTASLGDNQWRDLLDAHDRIATAQIARYEGRLVKTTGDGVLATFDGPARGIQCAKGIASAVGAIGMNIRAGVHTGEVERRGADISGLGVVIARRICDTASSGEVLASRTVKDLVTGSGIAFADRGPHTLKGVPDEWQLYAVEPGG